mmetsp:Transcript_38958/g.37287  ORF Transcript_38958/g.37287 Transcript_38958/m.37287 type:complete len:127 (-) Transcript_38958:955-1335(-)
MNKLQVVQYECIKSELKEEYEKRISALKQRMHTKVLKDPSFMLFQQMSIDQDKSTISPKGNVSSSAAGFLPGRNGTKPKFVSGVQNLNNGRQRKVSMGNADKINSKDKYYHFYLHTAQKAIDQMRL